MKKSQNITTNTNYSNDVSALQCPRCGSEVLHQRRVDIFACAEDQPDILVQVSDVDSDRPTIRIQDPSAKTNGNPSSRRDGIAIRFDCENCGDSDDESFIELTIGQHKGTTEIGWRFTDSKKAEDE